MCIHFCINVVTTPFKTRLNKVMGSSIKDLKELKLKVRHLWIRRNSDSLEHKIVLRYLYWVICGWSHFKKIHCYRKTIIWAFIINFHFDMNLVDVIIFSLISIFHPRRNICTSTKNLWLYRFRFIASHIWESSCTRLKV